MAIARLRVSVFCLRGAISCLHAAII